MTTKPLRLDVNEQIECAHTLASRFYTKSKVVVERWSRQETRKF